MIQCRAEPGTGNKRPEKGREKEQRYLPQPAQLAHRVCSEVCALELRDRLLAAGELTREQVESGQVQVGPDLFGNYVLVLLEDPDRPALLWEGYPSGAPANCDVCGSLCESPPTLSGEEGRDSPPGSGRRCLDPGEESMRERVLGLAALQLWATVELLRFYVETLDPWPEDIEAPPTELQEIWMEVQTAHETVVRRMEAGRARSTGLAGESSR